ncbi:MAG: BACON domain-containing protein [Alistipes sp.]|nr:BACON domain-containing protein [Alistipes sp.]
MKKIFSLFAVVALLFTSCEKAAEDKTQPEQPTPTPTEQIKLVTNDTMKVSSGSAMAFIKYEILELVEGAKVEVSANVDWIYDFKQNEQNKISFTIGANPEAVDREGIITVTYDKSQFTVTVIQELSEAPTSIVFEAEFLQGKYYGVQGGLFNYYLVFSDLGLDANNMYSTPNAHYYFVDLYLPNAPEDIENIVVPNGEYEYDITNSGWPNTFTHSFSWYHINDETGFQLGTAHYDTGKLIVEDGKVTLEVTLTIDARQENHKVVYEGDWSLIDCTNEVYE